MPSEPIGRLNLAIALLLAKDLCLYRSTWADLLMVIVMTQVVIHWGARKAV